MDETTAIMVLETLTGYLFENRTITEHYAGVLPDFLPYAPVNSVTITDLTEDVEFTDYSWHPDGAIIYDDEEGRWKVEYTAGYDGLEPDTPDPDANYAPDWAERLITELQNVELDYQHLDREKLGDYEYEIRNQLANTHPTLMSLINLNRRLVV